jgi:hypothetical protein
MQQQCTASSLVKSNMSSTTHYNLQLLLQQLNWQPLNLGFTASLLLAVDKTGSTFYGRPFVE